jgi:hypothetical protein
VFDFNTLPLMLQLDESDSEVNVPFTLLTARKYVHQARNSNAATDETQSSFIKTQYQPTKAQHQLDETQYQPTKAQYQLAKTKYHLTKTKYHLDKT